MNPIDAIFLGAIILMVLVAVAVVLGDFLADRRMVRNAMKDHTNPYIYSSSRKR